MWTGAILAGGQSRRLGGRNKARLTLAPPGGASVLDRQLARLSRVVDRTIIVANDADAYCDAGVPVIPGLTIREIGPEELAPFGPADVLFFNINTPDDYARAIELDGEYRSLEG